jgi:hypothetical protein
VVVTLLLLLPPLLPLLRPLGMAWHTFAVVCFRSGNHDPQGQDD